MAKSFVRIEKIKSAGTLKARWNHDINEQFRKEHVSNADSDKFELNDILVPCTDDEGMELSYDRAVKNRIKDLRQSNGKKIRKDSPVAYDIVLEFGDSDDIEAEGIDVNEWEKRSLEWLKETFDVAGDGKSNIISVVCHKDESSPHIHAIVTPVDERGCLCARSFTDGSSALSRLQDTYAEKLADLGIERGIKGSSAHHKSNRRYNAEKEKAAEIPKPQPDQSALEYYDLYNKEMEQRAINHKVQMDKLERNLRARMDKERLEQQNAINSEMDALSKHYSIKEEELKDEIDLLKQDAINLKKEVNELQSQKRELEQAIYDSDKTQLSAELYDHQQDVLKHISKNNPQLAKELMHLQYVAEQEYQGYIDSQEVQYAEEEIVR